MKHINAAIAQIAFWTLFFKLTLDRGQLGVWNPATALLCAVALLGVGGERVSRYPGRRHPEGGAAMSWTTATVDNPAWTAKWVLTASPTLEAFVILHQGAFYFGVAIDRKVKVGPRDSTTTREKAVKLAEERLKTHILVLTDFAKARWPGFCGEQ